MASIGNDSWLARLVGRIADAARYRRTVTELDQLDDRILADLGISRADIPAIAAGAYVRERAAGVPAVGPAANAAARHAA